MAIGACSGEAERACADPIDDDLDPLSSLHVLPGTEVDYLTDPPTSGPHAAGVPPSGVLDEPLALELQVSALEADRVVVQFRDPAALAAVAPLVEGARDDVIVAPNPDLTDPLVATAWTRRLVCPDASADAIEDVDAFIAEERAKRGF